MRAIITIDWMLAVIPIERGLFIVFELYSILTFYQTSVIRNCMRMQCP